MAISVLCERSDMNKHVEDARYYLKRASETAGKGLKEALEPVAARFRALTAEAEPEPSRLVALKADVNYPTLPRSGLLAPRLLGGGASCFCVRTCIQRGHSGSRLRRRLPFTGGLECPTPPRWTLDHNRQCALLVALEHRRRCGEYRTTSFGRSGSKRGGERVCEPCGRCIPSLLASSTLAEEWGLAPSI